MNRINNCPYCNKLLGDVRSKICKDCFIKFKKKNAKKYLCLDCGEKRSHQAKRCRKCSYKYFKDKYHPMYGMKGKKAPNYKYGFYIKTHYCIDCGKEICLNNALYGNKICRLCSTKGERHPNWQGGISKLPYPFKFSKELKEKIRKKDNYKCQLCEKSQKRNKRRLDIHHIDYNKKNIKENNLISLCNNCHLKTNWNRKYYKKLFNGIIQKY